MSTLPSNSISKQLSDDQRRWRIRSVTRLRACSARPHGLQAAQSRPLFSCSIDLRQQQLSVAKHTTSVVWFEIEGAKAVRVGRSPAAEDPISHRPKRTWPFISTAAERILGLERGDEATIHSRCSRLRTSVKAVGKIPLMTQMFP